MGEYEYLTVKEVNAVECSEGAIKREDYLAIASDWLMMQMEIARLRRIEAATLAGNKPRYAAEEWAELAEQFRDDGIVGWAMCCDAIAKALESE